MVYSWEESNGNQEVKQSPNFFSTSQHPNQHNGQHILAAHGTQLVGLMLSLELSHRLLPVPQQWMPYTDEVPGRLAETKFTKQADL